MPVGLLRDRARLLGLLPWFLFMILIAVLSSFAFSANLDTGGDWFGFRLLVNGIKAVGGQWQVAIPKPGSVYPATYMPLSALTFELVLSSHWAKVVFAVLSTVLLLLLSAILFSPLVATILVLLPVSAVAGGGYQHIFVGEGGEVIGIILVLAGALLRNTIYRLEKKRSYQLRPVRIAFSVVLFLMGVTAGLYHPMSVWFALITWAYFGDVLTFAMLAGTIMSIAGWSLLVHHYVVLLTEYYNLAQAFTVYVLLIMTLMTLKISRVEAAMYGLSALVECFRFGSTLSGALVVLSLVTLGTLCGFASRHQKMRVFSLSTVALLSEVAMIGSAVTRLEPYPAVRLTPVLAWAVVLRWYVASRDEGKADLESDVGESARGWLNAATGLTCVAVCLFYFALNGLPIGPKLPEKVLRLPGTAVAWTPKPSPVLTTQAVLLDMDGGTLTVTRENSIGNVATLAISNKSSGINVKNFVEKLGIDWLLVPHGFKPPYVLGTNPVVVNVFGVRWDAYKATSGSCFERHFVRTDKTYRCPGDKPVGVIYSPFVETNCHLLPLLPKYRKVAGYPLLTLVAPKTGCWVKFHNFVY